MPAAKDINILPDLEDSFILLIISYTNNNTNGRASRSGRRFPVISEL